MNTKPRNEQKKARSTAPTPALPNGNLERVIETIHREYDNDLEAFFRDVKARMQKRQSSEARHAGLCAT
jgi:hypothetical protein